MRARLAIAVSGTECELREIVLRDKAPEFLEASPKGTVPVVVDGDRVIEESFDVMQWALEKSDPEGWLDIEPREYELIERTDGPFKSALDRYKYSTRYGSDANAERSAGSEFLREMENRLSENQYLSGPDPKLTDYAIFPFVRQFANTDIDWFRAQDWPRLIAWLDQFLESDRFKSIMNKYPMWKAGDIPTKFPTV